MSMLASVLLLLQLSAALLSNAASNQNLTPEQRQLAISLGTTATTAALDYLAANPITTSTLNLPPVQQPAPTSTPSAPTSTPVQPPVFGGATPPVRVNLWKDLGGCPIEGIFISDYSINTPLPNGQTSYELNGNKNVSFNFNCQLRIEMTLNGETKDNVRPNNPYYNVIEFQNVPKGIYNFTIKFIKDNNYATWDGTINANSNCGSNPSCNITNTVFSTAQ